MKAGPWATIVEKGRQDPTTVSLKSWQGREEDREVGLPGAVFFLGMGLVLALTFRTSLAWNSGVQLW